MSENDNLIAFPARPRPASKAEQSVAELEREIAGLLELRREQYRKFAETRDFLTARQSLLKQAKNQASKSRARDRDRARDRARDPDRAREEDPMANLTGRPVQTKDEFKAEAEKLKAQRKADRGEATKQKFERKAGEPNPKRPVEQRHIDFLLAEVEKQNLSVEKARAWAEDVLRRNSKTGVDRFFEMAYEDARKGAFRHE